jgi:short-subunit dehydrogenase
LHERRFEPPAAQRAKVPVGDVCRVVVITGASSGIGRATAQLFGRQGWRVGLIARGGAGLRAVCEGLERLGASAVAAQADVTDHHALEQAAIAIECALGPIDAWVNCAGNATFGRFLDTPPEAFQRVTGVTYLGAVNGTRVALQHMMPRDHGRIVNVCSAIAFHGMPLLSSYSGAKHAMRGFDQAIRAELSQERSRVRLTTLFPPAVNTPFFDHAVSHMGLPGRPMAPVYQPEIVARAIHVAATRGHGEMPVSFTTILFSLCARLAPGLIKLAIARLGYGGQLTDRATALERYEPTLFAASDRPSPVRGAFDDRARSRSFHVEMMCLQNKRKTSFLKKRSKKLLSIQDEFNLKQSAGASRSRRRLLGQNPLPADLVEQRNGS